MGIHMYEVGEGWVAGVDRGEGETELGHCCMGGWGRDESSGRELVDQGGG